VASYTVEKKQGVLKFGAIAFVGYTSALAVNEIFRWTSMISVGTLKFLLQGNRELGFLNAIVLMPLAIILAVFGARFLIQGKRRSAMIWLGASLAAVGLNYIIYVVYSYKANSLNTLPLVDVWTVPLLGLGVALIINALRIRSN